MEESWDLSGFSSTTLHYDYIKSDHASFQYLVYLLHGILYPNHDHMLWFVLCLSTFPKHYVLKSKYLSDSISSSLHFPKNTSSPIPTDLQRIYLTVNNEFLQAHKYRFFTYPDPVVYSYFNPFSPQQCHAPFQNHRKFRYMREIGKSLDDKVGSSVG